MTTRIAAACSILVLTMAGAGARGQQHGLERFSAVAVNRGETVLTRLAVDIEIARWTNETDTRRLATEMLTRGPDADVRDAGTPRSGSRQAPELMTCVCTRRGTHDTRRGGYLAKTFR